MAEPTGDHWGWQFHLADIFGVVFKEINDLKSDEDEHDLGLNIVDALVKNFDIERHRIL